MRLTPGSIDLSRTLQTLETVAQPRQQDVDTEGLIITPAATRFSRIGTFPHHPDTLQPMGGGAFTDPRSRSRLILVYFDRACQLRGTIRSGDMQIDHSIDIPAAGLHWLAVKKLGNNHYRLEPHTDITDPLFSVVLQNLKSL